ncbi:hypothetical protein P280DRAFT_3151 [Massarina eburnea CBS 473.64]|uniref:Uncharacterized protein n=1 Tax=Massarina eburnea CBS 473.64 TaxID=1395130 RepID=A0A6A6SGV3_9PLEO|nr:hypothetical protein P280DRAFT_3151 [Massarina eburnea CBS 473.64]
MSDYGDDLSDCDDWLYVEEEYMVADDLAEHAVQSPPPTAYDDDALEDWDRFEYFLDLEYASDGYDDAKFEPKNGPGDTKIGEKRKRAITTTRARKRHKPAKAPPAAQGGMDMAANSPVVWRSQGDREARPKLLWEENAESYALMKDWREKLGGTPGWTQSSHSASPAASHAANSKMSHVSEAEAPIPHENIEEEDGETAGLDPTALLSVLQERLAAEGGPLSGMNPQQILQFAMRMANGEDDGEDVAGEMADEMLDKMLDGGEGDEEDGETEANLLSWVAQQRNTSNSATVNDESSGLVSTPPASARATGRKRLLTPPSSEATRSVRHKGDDMEDVEAEEATASTGDDSHKEAGKGSRKRKAVAETDSSKPAPKRRATRSYEASTASSQARTAPTRTTRSGRGKRL